MDMVDMYEDLPDAVRENYSKRLESGEEIEITQGFCPVNYLVDIYQFFNDYSPHMWLMGNCVYPRPWGRRTEDLNAILERRGYVEPRGETHEIRGVLCRPDLSWFEEAKRAIEKQKGIELERLHCDYDANLVDRLERMLPLSAEFAVSRPPRGSHPKTPGFKISIQF